MFVGSLGASEEMFMDVVHDEQSEVASGSASPVGEEEQPAGNAWHCAPSPHPWVLPGVHGSV